MDNLLDIIHSKAALLRQVRLAKTVLDELEYQPLDAVLARHLPGAMQDKLNQAAGRIREAVLDFYAELDTKADDPWVERQLNRGLAGLDTQEQAKWLVNVLNCAEEANPQLEMDDSLWGAINRETYTEAEVQSLIRVTRDIISQQAGFMKRQAFAVVEDRLDVLPEELLKQMMHSGEDSALAYAAAMYITCQQEDNAGEHTAYQLGLLAANAVESSKLLALYHLGKLGMEELMEKLTDWGKRMLTLAAGYALNAAAFGLRVGISTMASLTMWDMVTIMFSTTSPLAFAITMVGGIFVSMGAFTQEETCEMIVHLWEGVKKLASKVYHYFFDDDGPDDGGGSGGVCVQEKEQVYC